LEFGLKTILSAITEFDLRGEAAEIDVAADFYLFYYLFQNQKSKFQNSYLKCFLF
jgi:hypothetical protein